MPVANMVRPNEQGKLACEDMETIEYVTLSTAVCTLQTRMNREDNSNPLRTIYTNTKTFKAQNVDSQAIADAIRFFGGDPSDPKMMTLGREVMDGLTLRPCTRSRLSYAFALTRQLHRSCADCRW